MVGVRFSVSLLFAGLLTLATACKSGDDGPAAPVTNGSFMVFEVSDMTPDGPVTHDLKISFTQKGEMFEMKLTTTNASEEVGGPTMVNKELVPEDNVIAAYSLGRLWLPPQGRESGKRTPCGVVQREQKFRDWNVFPIDGICGRLQGRRYYEKTTGMLVGFMFSGVSDRTAFVKESG